MLRPGAHHVVAAAEAGHVVSVFDGMFGPPLTPEQQAAADKRRAEQRLAGHKRLTAGVAHLRDAQLALREAASCGVGGDRFEKSQRHLVVLLETIETELVRPT